MLMPFSIIFETKFKKLNNLYYCTIYTPKIKNINKEKINILVQFDLKIKLN